MPCSIISYVWTLTEAPLDPPWLAMVLGAVIFTITSRCACMSDGVCVDMVIGLLIGADLLLNPKACELFRDGADWIAFAILSVSWRMTAAAISVSRHCLWNSFCFLTGWDDLFDAAAVILMFFYWSESLHDGEIIGSAFDLGEDGTHCCDHSLDEWDRLFICRFDILEGAPKVLLRHVACS